MQKALCVAVQSGTHHKDAKQNSDDLGRLTDVLYGIMLAA